MIEAPSELVISKMPNLTVVLSTVSSRMDLNYGLNYNGGPWLAVGLGRIKSH